MEETEIVGEGRRHINKEETTKLNWVLLYSFPAPFVFLVVGWGERGWRDSNIFWFILLLLGFSLCIKRVLLL